MLATDAAWSCREGCSAREVVVKVATGALSGAFFAGKAEVIEKAMAGGAKAVAHIINGVGYGAVQEGIGAYKEPQR
jgi:hypothetical protein